MAVKDWVQYQRALDFLRFRSRAYKLTFQSREKNAVLKDLAKFCGADKSPRFFDLYRVGIAVGRREVWLRIQDHLDLQPDELYKIYNEPSSIQPPTRE